MRIVSALILGFSHCLISCTGKVSSADELITFVGDKSNGCVKMQSIDGTDIKVTYRPTDLLVSQETSENFSDHAFVSALRKKYDPYYYFVVSLARGGREALHQPTTENYSELVNTLSFDMRRYVTLTTSEGDSIPVSDFMLNRTFNVSSSTDLLFVFSKEKIGQAEWVQFNLNEFGLKTGDQRFRFKTKDLDRTPRLDVTQD